jgi:cytochrome o ubiquinol oxidase subunit 1
MIGVSALALSVWLHHFFTMGASADVNSFFGVMTMVIAIPTSVLFFTWIATMYKGKIKFETPMLWFLGFVAIFAIGGIAGVMLAVPPADFQLHNSLFLVAHFHSMVIGGVLFGVFCGLNYWFPKITGYKINQRIGRSAFWCWIIGFCMSFIPMYVLGFMGATRRLDHYEKSTGWQPLFIMMFIGGVIIMLGVALQIAQIVATFIQKKQHRDVTGDPWDGRTLEWATASPAPSYNFTSIPTVTERDAFYEMKQKGLAAPVYEDILMPHNTASGIYISGFAFLVGFGFVWEIKWLVVVGIVGILAVFVKRTFNDHTEFVLPAAEVKKLEEARIKKTKQQSAHEDEEELGIWGLLQVIYKFGLTVIKEKRWKKW